MNTRLWLPVLLVTLLFSAAATAQQEFVPPEQVKTDTALGVPQISEADYLYKRPVEESSIEVGDFLFPIRGFGYFGTTASSKAPKKFRPYITEFSLWAGAVVNGREVVVTGEGNEYSVRPEWAHLMENRVKKENLQRGVKQMSITYYDDRAAFKGHEPAGLSVKQTLYGFANSKHVLLDFEVTNTSGERLSGVYIGLKALIQVPDSDGKARNVQNQFGFIDSTIPVVRTAGTDMRSSPLMGVFPLASGDYNIAWWNEDAEPATDRERYAMLAGTPMKRTTETPGLYTMLVGLGPVDLLPEETQNVTFVIGQGNGAGTFRSVKRTAYASAAEANLSSSIDQKILLAKQSMAKPETYKLTQNYPNPFNMNTSINFHLSENGHVTLTIYSITGEKVAQLVSKSLEAGIHDVSWNGMNSSGQTVASGMYLYRISVDGASGNNFSRTMRMVLMK